VTADHGASAPPSDTPYAGLATRGVAFAADAAIIDGVALLVAVVVGLCLSVVDIGNRGEKVLAAVGAVVAVVWAIAYFTFFWSTTGQTPGNRLMGIRVQTAADGSPPRPRRAFVRVLLLPVSALLLGAGFLMILFDRRRRALHDRIAGTVVVYAQAAQAVPAPAT
jgi:uncharacterized RDD family membrane protein YckC